MAVQLIIGSSGSGKTTYLFQKIVEEAKANRDKNYLVIVPEQFTLHTQQTLVELSDGKAIMNIDVLSFKRLAFRVFEETGIQNLQILEETGKNLVLRKIAQEKEKELTVMRPNIGKIGYISEIKSMISELMQYNISSEALRTFSEKGQLSKQLSYKLQDIVTMYEGFEQFLKGSFVTAEEILHVLARVAHKSQILKHAVLAFDEFTGFTPVQNELLQVLMPLVEKIYITVAMDAREQLYSAAQEFELFSMPKKTIRSILDIAERAHQPVEEPVLLKDAAQKRFVHAPALAFMEQHLFRSKLQSFSKIGRAHV